MNVYTLGRYIGIGLSILLVFYLISYFSEIVSYIVISWIISLLGTPLMSFFLKFRIKRVGIGRSTAAGLTLLSFMTLISLVFYLFVPMIFSQASKLANVDYASIAKSLEKPLERLQKRFQFAPHSAPSQYIPPKKKEESKKDSTNHKKLTIIVEDGQVHYPQKTIIDTTRIIKPKQDTTSKASKEDTTTVLTKKNIVLPIDNIRANDSTVTIYRNPREKNVKIELALQLNVENDYAKNARINDPTAQIKPHDSPLEQLQKEVFSFLNPAQISLLFSQIVGLLGHFMIALFSIGFISFFFLKEERLFSHIIEVLTPDRYDEQMMLALEQIKRMLTRYFGGLVIQMIGISSVVSICLTLFGVKNALLIGVFTGMINIVPYAGPIIGTLFGALIVISTNVDLDFYAVTLPQLYSVLITMAIAKGVDDFILQPTIFSSSIMAHPLEIFLVVLIAHQLGGILGMLVALPLYTILRVIAKVFLSQFRVVQELTKRMKN